MGHKKEDIIAGLCKAVVSNYLNNVGKGKKIKPPIVFQGGVSKNIGVIKAFEEATGEEIEATINNQPFVVESVVVDRGASLVALVYIDKEKLAESGVELGAHLDTIKAEINRQMPAYSKISKIEVMEQPFEMTPKMSIKRFMYK